MEEINSKTIEEIIKLPHHDFEKLIKKIKDQRHTEEKKELRKKMENYSDLIGKCFKIKKQLDTSFPEMWRYYKIISPRAKDSQCVSVLCFDEHPTYWFSYYTSKTGRPEDYYLGNYIFSGIEVENFPFFYPYFEKTALTEITLEEYNKAMNSYISELQKIKWPADHWRRGGKLPSDSEWEEKMNELC